MRRRFPAPESLLITGASSGLGGALACAAAAPGRRLALTGRAAARLAQVAAICRSKGAEVASAVFDIRDPEVDRWIGERHAAAPIDLFIANAGVLLGAGDDPPPEPWPTVEEVLSVNAMATLRQAAHIGALMRSRGHGQLALISSQAAIRGLSGAPAYCASKAAVTAFAQGLRPNLAPYGVGVTVVLAGFIDTPMIRCHRGPKPLMMDSDEAARLILHRLRANPGRLAFPRLSALAMVLISLLPSDLGDRLLRASAFTVGPPDR